MKRTWLRVLILFQVFTLIFSMNSGVSRRVQAKEGLAQTVSVASQFGGGDQVNFQLVLTDFTNQTGITTTYEDISSDPFDRLLNCTSLGNCPDIALIPNPGLVGDLVNQGTLIPLDEIVTDFDLHYSTTWRTLGSVNGDLYAIPFKAQSKSIIWYRPQAFTDISAAVPETWTGLLSVSDAFVLNGQTPFSIGAESGVASGWPLTDWFENILLRVGGPGVHRQLAQHEIAWTNPIVVLAMERFRDIVGRGDYQRGGIDGTLNTFFMDALEWVFGPSPTAAMYFGGGFMQGIIASNYPGLTPVIDYNIFQFPEINPTYGKPTMGGADFAIVFHDTAEARALIQYLASPEAAEVWAALGGFVSPNSGVDINLYPDALTRAQAQQLIGANDFVFDLDDQLPADLQHYVWGAMMDFVAQQDQMIPILQGIENTATLTQGAPYSIFLPITIR